MFGIEFVNVQTSEVWFSFRRTISCESVRRACEQMFSCLSDYEKIHLLLDTPGGALSAAIPFARFLYSMRNALSTYNIGSVNSAGILLFATGSERIVVGEGEFRLHEVMTCMTGYVTLSALKETVNILDKDKRTMLRMLEKFTGTPMKRWDKMMNNQFILSHSFALKHKLATRKMAKIPDVTSIVTL